MHPIIICAEFDEESKIENGITLQQLIKKLLPIN